MSRPPAKESPIPRGDSFYFKYNWEVQKNGHSKNAPVKGPTRDAEATRASIMDAAEEEFSRYGLQGARTESIAAQTGVTKAMIHYYFESKENLYREVLRRTFTRRTQTLESLNLSALAPTAALKVIFDDLLAEMFRHPTIASILFFESLQNRGQYYREISVASLYGPMIDVLERGVASGEFRPELEPRHTAINLVGMTVFYICASANLSSLWPDNPDLLSEKLFHAHAEETVAMVLNSVLKH
ncbi:MAG: TetR family transcriptional regulator [Cyanobacteria bacterium SZAS TMP-1]|nr:TetR family transcriptional regulator [Cyanobacteria bacterium SZAS TMP-1]